MNSINIIAHMQEQKTHINKTLKTTHIENKSMALMLILIRMGGGGGQRKVI